MGDGTLDRFVLAINFTSNPTSCVFRVGTDAIWTDIATGSFSNANDNCTLWGETGIVINAQPFSDALGWEVDLDDCTGGDCRGIPLSDFLESADASGTRAFASKALVTLTLALAVTAMTWMN